MFCNYFISTDDDGGVACSGRLVFVQSSYKLYINGEVERPVIIYYKFWQGKGSAYMRVFFKDSTLPCSLYVWVNMRKYFTRGDSHKIRTYAKVVAITVIRHNFNFATGFNAHSIVRNIYFHTLFHTTTRLH